MKGGVAGAERRRASVRSVSVASKCGHQVCRALATVAHSCMQRNHAQGRCRAPTLFPLFTPTLCCRLSCSPQLLPFSPALRLYSFSSPLSTAEFSHALLDGPRGAFLLYFPTLFLRLLSFCPPRRPGAAVCRGVRERSVLCRLARCWLFQLSSFLALNSSQKGGKTGTGFNSADGVPRKGRWRST